MQATRKPRVKICCIKSPDEAAAAVAAGAAALGLVSSMPSGPGIIDEPAIAAIAASVPPPVATFLLTSLTDPEDVIRQHNRCRTSTIQLCDYLDPTAYTELRRRLPGIRLVQVIHVLSELDVDRAERIAPCVDALLVDSGNPALANRQLGGTGRVHDWKLSARIRERIRVPLFLAGGLTPQNLQQAIAQVGPFALDVCTGVRTDDKLDQEKLAAFFAAVETA